MKIKLLALLATLLPAIAIGQTTDNPDAPLPKVVLVGDSIRLSYASDVAKALAGQATVVSPKGNGGDSSNVLRQLDAWVIRERPAVVHFNCGIHDTKKFKATGKFQVSPEQYETNLRTIVAQFVGEHLPEGSVENEKPAGPWSLEKLRTAPELTWIDEKSPIRSLTYRNEAFQKRETDVFAFYATPGSISGDITKDVNLPAVVLIHGGGGTAFDEWAWLWAKRGYAAIAMDLSGRRPEAPTFDAKTGELIINRRAARTRLERGGPEADHVAKFTNVGGDITDDWQFHAVAAVIRAHSLIRSFPEVDAERTAVTGISWGGYMTCLVASIDDRFKAAVPVYGCGFLYEGESVQKPLIDELGEEKRAEWIRVYEPSAWLPECRVPIFFVNGTNDKHYPLTSYARSYELVKGSRQIRIQVKMPHSHVSGWAPTEIGLFIDQHVNKGTPLPKLGAPTVVAGVVKASVVSSLAVKAAELHFTADSGPLVSRKWQSVKAAIVDGSVSAPVPPDATIWMLSVTDSREAMVSTEVVFRDAP